MSDRHDHANTIGETVHSKHSAEERHDTAQTVIDCRSRNTVISQSNHDYDVDSL